jgi:hypothetical protein
MRIEQRIGRIDRYGQQSQTVAIVNFVTPGTVDADIYERCLMRIGVFQHAVGGNEEILGTITKQLHDIAESFELSREERSQRLQQLADNTIRQVREEQELETKQAELFGLNIPNKSWRDEIESFETFWLSAASIQRTVTTYLAARLSSDAQHLLGDKPLKTLRLSAPSSRLLAIGRSGLRVRSLHCRLPSTRSLRPIILRPCICRFCTLLFARPHAFWKSQSRSSAV